MKDGARHVLGGGRPRALSARDNKPDRPHSHTAVCRSSVQQCDGLRFKQRDTTPLPSRVQILSLHRTWKRAQLGREPLLTIGEPQQPQSLTDDPI
jgi:hypothetical protein